MSDEKIVIDENNFAQHFKEAGKFPPDKGDSMAIFRACAEFVDGDIKRDVVNKLKQTDGGARFAIQILMKKCNMSYRESIKICKEVCKDLESMSEEDVLNKPYKFLYENKYFVKKELVPENNPHWELVNLKSVTVEEKKADVPSEKIELE
jgi:hypothetical protein